MVHEFQQSLVKGLTKIRLISREPMLFLELTSQDLADVVVAELG